MTELVLNIDDDMAHLAKAIARKQSDLQTFCRKQEEALSPAGSIQRDALEGDLRKLKKLLLEQARTINPGIISPDVVPEDGEIVTRMKGLVAEDRLLKLLNDYVAGIASSLNVQVPESKAYFEVQSTRTAQRG